MQPDLPDKPRVLFLCVHNSARSQMAEALVRHQAGGRVEAASAGSEPTRVHPLAIRAMAEIGIDIAGQGAKRLDAVLDRPYDHVITLCDEAAEACPGFPGRTQMLHWSFDDPSAAAGAEAERLAAFRRVRDGLQERIRDLLRQL